jgi:hypothetical protein
MEKTENLNEFLYGKEAAEKIKRLNYGLLKIENENFEFFENRIAKNNGKDRLHNHYIIQTDIREISFKFISDSDLD